MNARQILDATMTEQDFQAAVIAYARAAGWKVMHSRPAQNARGRWATHIAGDIGFPDLVLVRERVLFRELKREGGRLRPEQKAWLDQLIEANADADVWMPSDWPLIARELGPDSEGADQ